jgi:hypothetical protein
MGVSTDAILFHGYCWDDETTLFEDGEWAEAVLKKRGVHNPWDDYPPEIERVPDYEQRRKAGEEWTAVNRSRLDDWYAAKKAVEEEFGVEVGGHCSGDCSMPYVAIKGAGETAHRGYPKEVPDLAVDPTWAAKLDRFLAEFGIEKPHPEPKWWLVSYWG